MKRLESIVVDLLRDFLVAHEILDALVEAHDVDRLEFADVAGWAGDDASSPLFRLKEHCHALVRCGHGGAASVEEIGPAELLDLVVGSLFHEAMKLRENLYQIQHYAVRVERLRQRAHTLHAESMRELEHLLELSGRHLHEAFYEARSLMMLTRRHVRALMHEHARSGLVARALYEQSDSVARVFDAEAAENGEAPMLESLYGGAAQAALAVARSFLESAYFEEALEALEEASERGADAAETRTLMHYASGMRAFLAGSYRESLDSLCSWVELGGVETAPSQARWAAAAVARLDKLVETEDSAELLARAKDLSDELARRTRAPGRPRTGRPISGG